MFCTERAKITFRCVLGLIKWHINPKSVLINTALFGVFGILFEINSPDAVSLGPEVINISEL